MALAIECGGDHAKATEHPRCTEAFRRGVDMAHAVEQGQDRSLRSDRRRKSGHGTLEVICLAAQQHEVIRRLNLFAENSPDGNRMSGTVWRDDGEAIGCEFCGALRPNEKSNITAGIRQLSAKIAADGASPDNKHAHEYLLVFAMALPPTFDANFPFARCNGRWPRLLAKTGLHRRTASGRLPDQVRNWPDNVAPTRHRAPRTRVTEEAR